MFKIINIKSGQPYDWYIGRENKSYNLKESIFCNPFVIGVHGSRAEVIDKFKEYAKSNKQIMDNLYLLDGKTLACWCDYPKEDCHGRILMELREKQKSELLKFNVKCPIKIELNKKYRTAVVGSRNFNDTKFIFDYLDSKIDKIESLVSGGCPTGADNAAEKFAKERGLSITIHYPNWKNGRGAGLARNEKIVNDSEILIAFWTGSSKGTKYSIDLAKKLGKKVIIHNVEPDNILNDIAKHRERSKNTNIGQY